MAEAELGRISPSSDGRYTLTFERDFDQSQSVVWAAITAAELVGCWLSEAEIDLRPGGKFRLQGQCDVDGQVLEVSAPDRFRWTWPHPDHPDSEVEIAVSALTAGSSRVILTQSDLPKRHVLGCAAGWHTHLEALSGATLGSRTAFDPARAARHYRRYSAAFVP